MICEEQAALLLQRCELVAGKRLNGVRGNLLKAEHRAAAVWELLVLEELSRHGKVRYEPREGPSPDFQFEVSGTSIWIEAAFLYPRFWKEQKISRLVDQWLHELADRKGVLNRHIGVEFYGDIQNPAGPVRVLPGEHEKKRFLRGESVQSFFDAILASPREVHRLTHPDYTVRLVYLPDATEAGVSRGGGLVQEVAKTAKEHAVFRSIKKKARQHRLSEPRAVFLATDQSPAVSQIRSPGATSIPEAIGVAFSENQRISAVALVAIRNEHALQGRLSKVARGYLYLNPDAKNPIPEEIVPVLEGLNFSRWAYTFPHRKENAGPRSALGSCDASVQIRIGMGKVKEIELPASEVMAWLQGKSDPAGFIEQMETLRRVLAGNLQIKGCSFRKGDTELGEDDRIVLTLAPGYERVFWPTDES